jgi:hypothetical protein
MSSTSGDTDESNTFFLKMGKLQRSQCLWAILRMEIPVVVIVRIPAMCLQLIRVFLLKSVETGFTIKRMESEFPNARTSGCFLP